MAQEYDVVKNIMQTLNQFKVFQFMSISNDCINLLYPKGNHHDTQSVGPRSMQSFEVGSLFSRN